MHTQTRQKHDNIVLEVLKRLCVNGLCIAPDKCQWAQRQVEFLGYIVSGQGIEMTDEKVKTLKDIEPINSPKDVQYFIGFANFYRRFIKDYSKICLPLTNSTALKPSEWRTTPEIQVAQKTEVDAFTSAPVLKHFDPDLSAIVETDASDFAVCGILSQQYKGQLHPVV